MVTKEYIITAATIILLAYTASLSLVNQAFPATQNYSTFNNIGTIQIQTTAGIEIYEDYQCNYELTSISWGTIEPGESQSIDFYVKNTGNTPTTLSYQTTNWNPSNAGLYMNLDWDYAETSIDADGLRKITLTLTINPNIQGIENFSFDVTIIGTT